MQITRIGSGVHAVTCDAASWVLLSDGHDLTVIDGGYPGDADRLVESIVRIGHQPQDVRGVLLTHAHVDHLGGVVPLLARTDAPLLMHPLEVAAALGHHREQATPVDVAVRAWRPRVARWALHVVASGGAGEVLAPRARAFPHPGALDLPGRPVPVHTGAHTSGHCGYHLPSAGVLVTGDVVVTGHPLSTRTGPQLLPGFFAHEHARLDVALAAFEPLPAEVIAPGHGPPWHGSPDEAVALARA